jgi:beta-N-acetylhexosaminidase
VVVPVRPLALAALLVVAGAAPAFAAQATPEAAVPGCATTLPERTAPVVTDGIRERVAAMPVEAKVGQLLMAGVVGSELGADEAALFSEGHLGNAILMGRNVDDPGQVLALTRQIQEAALAANGVGAIVATDQEGGLVQRLNSVSGFTGMPDAATVGLADCPAVVRAYGRMAGEEMAAVGVTMAMAPVLDTDLNPDNPVIGQLGRSFATTPDGVVAAALPFMAGLHDAGVMAVGKHFPGHGSTSTDSHLDLPVVDKSREALLAEDVVPFAAAIGAGIDGIMPAHVLYPALDPDDRPATVSRPIQTGLLREGLGFEGLIVTDDMGMKGITSRYAPREAGVAAVLAGADIVLCVRMESASSCTAAMYDEIRAGLLAAVADGTISPERLDASVGRVLAAKATYGAAPADGAGLPEVKGAAHLRTLAALYDAIAAERERTGHP